MPSASHSNFTTQGVAWSGYGTASDIDLIQYNARLLHEDLHASMIKGDDFRLVASLAGFDSRFEESCHPIKGHSAGMHNRGIDLARSLQLWQVIVSGHDLVHGIAVKGVR